MTAGWSKPAFEKYLGSDEAAWRAYDATVLIEDGHRLQRVSGRSGSRRWLPRRWVCGLATAGRSLHKGWHLQLTLRMQEGYDHSYNFISTFMDDHLRWHAERL
jgi:S-formylglutathione hydrolase